MRSIKSEPIVSIVLVAVNILVFAICAFTGNVLYDMGMLDAYQILTEREYAGFCGLYFFTAECLISLIIC